MSEDKTIQLPKNVKWIIEILQQHGYEAYAVGGCIRDSILGRIPDDWDVTTSAKPTEIKKIFQHTIDTGLLHGTVTILMGKEGYEITTYRIDGVYEDHRHPREVMFTADLAEDLKRRDFTINAMAYNEQNGIIDLFGGQNDLNDNIVRCVGNPKERFEEDALRILRAVRFAAQLGFQIEVQTKKAMAKLAKNLEVISAERIQVELVKLLISPNPQMLKTAYNTGITAVILPEFDRMMNTPQYNPHHKYNVGVHTLKAVSKVKADRVLRLAMLFHDIAKPDTEFIDEQGVSHFHGHGDLGEEMVVNILRRLRFDNDTLHKVKRLVKWHDDRIENVTEKSVRRAVAKIGADIYPDLLEVMYADMMAQSEYKREEKKKQLAKIRKTYQSILEKEQCITLKQLAVTGADLIEIGIPHGKQIGTVLQQLLEQVLDCPGLNTKEQLMDLAKDIPNHNP